MCEHIPSDAVTAETARLYPGYFNLRSKCKKCGKELQASIAKVEFYNAEEEREAVPFK